MINRNLISWQQFYNTSKLAKCFVINLAPVPYSLVLLDILQNFLVYDWLGRLVAVLFFHKLLLGNISVLVNVSFVIYKLGTYKASCCMSTMCG